MDSFVVILAVFQVEFPSNKQRGKFLHYYCAVEFKCKCMMAKKQVKQEGQDEEKPLIEKCIKNQVFWLGGFVITW